MSDERSLLELSRRDFLKAGAGAGAALIVGFHLPLDALASQAAGTPLPEALNAWIRIGEDGAVRLILCKSELGQGVMTSLPMILADELDADWERVQVEQAISDPAVYRHTTGGSTSVRTLWLPLRRAAAAARTLLVGAASAAWKSDAAACRTEKGFVIHDASKRRLAYGDLVAVASKLPVPNLETVPLKAPEAMKLVGRSVPRLDIPSKVDGTARYGMDVRVPGMLFAAIARCPAFGGKAKRFEASKAKAVPGVRQVVEIPPVVQGAHSTGGIAVVADTTWAALRGRDALVVEWDPGPHVAESNETLRAQFEKLMRQPGTLVRDEGDAGAALATAARKIEAVYELPFQAHAPMEPLNATVDVRDDRAEAWLSTQASDWNFNVIRGIAKVPPERVVVHTTMVGGGFGRRAQADFAAEAAQVSAAVKAPVQVVWTREDDMRHDFYRPASCHRLQAALDDGGLPVAWLHRLASTSISAFNDPGAGKPEDMEIDGAVNPPYRVPNLRVEYAPAASGVPVAWWRSVEHSQNAFVVESFVDELAAAAKFDPLDYRLRLLGEPRTIRVPEDIPEILDTARLAAVLRLCAAKAGWGTPLAPGRGRGIAAHFCFHSYAAHAAEVSVGKGGEVRVHRVVAAVDCGRVVHPDGIAQQVEGAVAFALSATLSGSITVKAGRAVQGNFDDFPVTRIVDMPAVEVHIVPSDAAPTGIGEPGVPPLAPAVTNAIFAVTGKRVRRLPVRPEDLI